MKFGELTSSPGQIRADVSPTILLTLEQGVFAGRTFNVRLSVCDNPCCPCEAIGFVCEPDTVPGDDGTKPPDRPTALQFHLDVFTRTVNTGDEPAPGARMLARAITAELQSADWESLAQFFLATKRQKMESMNLDTLHVQFPREVMRGNDSMVAYKAVFPWADSFGFLLGDSRWMADDQYCVEPGCDCTQTALDFFQLAGAARSSSRPLKSAAFLRWDYVAGRIAAAEVKPANPAPAELMQALRTAHPEFEQSVRRRHAHLQQLGRRLLRKRRRSNRPLSDVLEAATDEQLQAPPAPKVQPARVKTGRNEPCPCGSGRKYKKCCGT